MRVWDARAALGVDRFVANSHFVARRIAKAYRRPAAVVYPPVDTTAFTPAPESTASAERGAPHEQSSADQQPYYVTAGRFVSYKRIPLIVEAFQSLPDCRLVVVGNGPDWAEVARRAGRNVTLVGRQPFEQLREWLRGARAFLFAAVEDFGIAPVEAQACGVPVIAYAGGAVRESIAGVGATDPTGVLYDAQTPAALADAVRQFERGGAQIAPAACRRNAERFSIQVFRERMGAALAQSYADHATALHRSLHAGS